MAKMILVRHGHVEGIEPARFRGRRDVPLTAEGERQARAAAACIATRWRPVAVYTSPLRRCVETGREIAAACGLDAAVLEELIDLDYGAWEWRTREEVGAGWPERYEQWVKAPHLVRFPQGESLQDLVARTANVIRYVLERHAAETVVLVGHDSGIRTMLLQLLDQPLSAYWRLGPEPGALGEVDVLAHGAKVLRFNDAGHLAPPAR
ncbi:MAG: histidine phosphatase family protein [Steroidobacteraceae bacterium]